MSSTIDVNISLNQSYQIWVDNDLTQTFQSFGRKHYSRDKILVVTDEKVKRLHEETIADFTQGFDSLHHFAVPEGEESKSVARWTSLVDQILQVGIERNTPLLAVGGGVTGDLGGFVASSVLRGIPLIHIPTSLLAMVDSSIGGKTGVNHETGKNLIGAFYQPDAVFADTSFLGTLEKKEWITGLAEILKYAAIRKPSLFSELESLIHASFEPSESWTNVIRESAQIKVDIVEEDTLEAGSRAFLNFGHTFGHALEKLAGYGTLSHGEAVFVGMIAATYFSKQLGHPVDEVRFGPFRPLYKKQIKSLDFDVDHLIEAMKTDKKVKDGVLRLVLLKEWGSPYIYKCTENQLLEEAWEYALAQFN